MAEALPLSNAKRLLLDKYLRADLQPGLAGARTIPRRESDGPAPLSFGQQQVWFFAQLLPEIPLYNEPVTIHRSGPLDLGILERSFTEILRRHEMWRTTFTMSGGGPVQVIHPPGPVRLPLVDLSSLPRAEREVEALRLATEEARQPFDLERGPLFRATVIRMGDAEYRLFLALHHIIFDGVSIYDVLIPELTALYDAFSRGGPSPLSEPPVQYADFAHWQRQTLTDERLEKAVTFWRGELDEPLPVLELPTDHPRPAALTYRGAMHPFVLPPWLCDACRTVSRRAGATLYMTMLAAFVALLHRYAAQDDIVVGTFGSGRNRTEVERLLGYFLQTLVLRIDVSGNPTFEQLLGRVRETVLGALSHDEVPFQHLVKALRPERDPSRNPLFQTAFSLEPPLSRVPPGWGLTQMDVEVGTSKFDLYLELDDRQEEGILGRFVYSTDLFEASTIARMVTHFETLLKGIAADPSQLLSALPLLTSPERQQMLVEWNATSAEYPREACIHQLVEAQVAKTPDGVALVFEDQVMTYGELDRRANQLAHHLRAFGVGPDVLVGLCLERSLDLVVGLIGILKAGGAYVPLDPHFPKDRLALMLQDSRASVLVTEAALLGHLSADGPTLVCLDRDAAAIAVRPETPMESGTTSQDLAYMIYTSGSTGRPKGVQVSHRAVVNLLTAMAAEVGVGNADVLVAVTTLSFDIAGLELYLPLMSGARLVVAGWHTAFDGAALCQLMARSRVTVMQATPATWRLVIEAGWEGSPDIRVLCGGEPLPQSLARQLVQRCAQVWNVYGPTETTIWSTGARVRADEAVTIGRPLANTRLYVLDAHQQPVPVGVPGELYIGGDGLARGYLNRPDATAESFVHNPFSDEPEARLYRTGDLVRYSADGQLDFLGRRDDQVKVRGFRIELGEVESALRTHPAVRDAAVAVREDRPGDHRLVAYIVANGEPISAPTLMDLRAHLGRILPDYMLPAAAVMIQDFPRTPNGKLDRRALPEPSERHSEGDRSYIAPRDELERRLTAIWERELRVQPIGITENFFHLGGDSLTAVRVFNQIEKLLEKRLPFSPLFDAPTVEQLAEILRQRRWSPRSAALV